MTTTTKPSIAVDSASPKLHHGGQEVQRYGTLRTLPLSLGDGPRLQSCELLNQVLADTVILYNLYKKHHWLVSGPTFY